MKHTLNAPCAVHHHQRSNLPLLQLRQRPRRQLPSRNRSRLCVHGLARCPPQRRTALAFQQTPQIAFEPVFKALPAALSAVYDRSAVQMPLDSAGKDFLLRAQHRSMTETDRRECPDARWEVVESAGKPVGLLVTHVGERCVTFVDIALLPAVQGRGLATRLMALALDEPRRLGLPARVTVLMTNAASLGLCARLGFARRSEAPPFVELEWRPDAEMLPGARARLKASGSNAIP